MNGNSSSSSSSTADGITISRQTPSFRLHVDISTQDFPPGTRRSLEQNEGVPLAWVRRPPVIPIIDPSPNRPKRQQSLTLLSLVPPGTLDPSKMHHYPHNYATVHLQFLGSQPPLSHHMPHLCSKQEIAKSTRMRKYQNPLFCGWHRLMAGEQFENR